MGPEPLIDRRARVIAAHELVLEPRQVRKKLEAFEDSLVDLDPGMLRPVRLLVSQLMAQWLALEGPFRTMVLRVSVLAATIRIDISAKPEINRHGFWDSLVTPHVEDLVIDWGIDRRGSSGAWFEIEREHRSGHAESSVIGTSTNAPEPERRSGVP